jgi:hypothetical protein
MSLDQFTDSGFDFDAEKKRFVDNLEKLKNMSVEEQTFYKKFKEIKQYRDMIQKSGFVKAKIWTPTDIQNKDQTVVELKNLQPEIVFVDPKNADLMHDWLMLRIFCHSMSYDQNPGRFLRFLVRDKVTGKYLGFTSVVSDVIVITVRDEWIGWTKENKLVEGKLRCSAIGSCIAPTQPFGFNFIGGKLVAILTASSVVRNKWKELYGDTLVGMTTTSLYGQGSMYDGMDKWWRGVGESTGKVSIKPDDEFYEVWHQYVKDNYGEKYLSKMTQKEGVSGPVTGAKQRVMSMICQATGVTSSHYQHGFKRGVYYAMVYENGKEFLQGKIEEKDLKIKDQWSKDENIVEWWREKAIKRYIGLHEKGILKPDILFYNTMAQMSYTEAKKNFFKEVGR